MLIKQTRVQNAHKYIALLKTMGAFRVCTDISKDVNTLLKKAGFPENAVDGDSILPDGVGTVSRFNAEGKYVTLTDEEKESRYITTIEWSWEQWCGRGETKTVTESKDIYKDCYPQEFIKPPGVELIYVCNGNSHYITTNTLDAHNISADELKHIINLFLELFGECELRKADFASIIPAKVKRLNWRILPPGNHPWDQVKTQIRQQVKHRDPRYSNIILARQETISSYEPDEVFVGEGGFKSYVAYVFKKKGIVVLESTEHGNATYVFDKNWQQFSKMTKAEILSNSYQKERVIHSEGWGQRVNGLLN